MRRGGQAQPVPGQRLPVVDADGTVIGDVLETGILTKRALDLAREALAGEYAREDRGNRMAARRVT
jgi:hypothetical protein